MGSKPVRSKFFIFLEPGKKSEIFFSRKNRDFSENIGIYQKIRRFFADFFTSDFSTRKSFPASPKTDFSLKNQSKKSIFFVHGYYTIFIFTVSFYLANIDPFWQAFLLFFALSHFV